MSCKICEKEPDSEFDNAPFFCTNCAMPLSIQSGVARCVVCNYNYEFRVNGAVAIISVIYSEESQNQSNPLSCPNCFHFHRNNYEHFKRRESVNKDVRSTCRAGNSVDDPDEDQECFIPRSSNRSSECECGSGYDLVNHKLCHVCGRKVCLNCASMSSPEDIEENKFYCNKHRPYNWSSNQSLTTSDDCINLEVDQPFRKEEKC